MTNTVYETVIGLEIHAELATKTKLFCSCKNDPFGAAEPNVNICPTCLALPGSLPVMNRQAVEWSALVGLGLGCDIGHPANSKSQIANRQAESDDHSPFAIRHSLMTKWDRKNYFYPDLPKGYQISQYDLPIVHGGKLEIHLGDELKSIEITRIHLEEDTGKLVHPEQSSSSLIDYNRAGVPLLELVTEPVIRSSEEAAAFAQMYQLVLRTLGIANSDMEKGEMRVEANISVRPVGSTTFGTKVEVKNLNSFKSVERAIAYETERQIAALEAGEPLRQETRGWDEAKQRTFVQRVKETAADYRYFPEPDLPPVTIEIGDSRLENRATDDPNPQSLPPAGGSNRPLNLEEIKRGLPEMPWAKRERYLAESLAPHDAERLVFDLELSRKYDRLSTFSPEPVAKKLLANWIINGQLDFDPEGIDELLAMVTGGEVTTKLAKDILEKMKSTGKTPRVIMVEEGLSVVRDASAIDEHVQAVIDANPQAVADYSAGKQQALGYLVGQVMARTRGQADPAIVREALGRKLDVHV